MPTSPEPRWPHPLPIGARIALVAPAGPVRGPEMLRCAMANVEALQAVPVVAPHAMQQRGYLAGTDAERAADLQWALDDPAVEAVWCIRGGYGVTRLLPHLTFDGLRQRPKPVLGYSDITALHVALGQATGLVTFHAHMAGRTMHPLAATQLAAALRHEGLLCGRWAEAVPLVPGVAAGRLAGGNLAVLSAMVGTPWAPTFRDALVVLEDVGEAAYRVDRMLVQLEQAGSFAGVRGLICGRFTEVPADVAPDAPSCESLVQALAMRLAVPCLGGVPIGHVPDQWVVPLGAHAILDVAARTVHVALPSLA